LAATFAAGAAGFPLGANAADLGGDCCADLEERIADLESTTARKGNRKVSLTEAGQVSKAILAWDDGFEDNVYVVGNKNDQSNLSFTGEAEIAKGWKAGYELTIRLTDNLSDAVDQDVPDAGDGFFVWQSHWFIESEKLGKFSMGLASRVSDTAPETDLSEAGLAGYAGVQDIGGGFALRLSDGSLAPVGWGDVYNHFNGDTANIVRYDTPEIAGFVASASWGEDDVWDVGLRYSGEGGGFTYEGAIAYTELTDGTNAVIGNTLGLDQHTLVGSFSVLHNPTGLNVTFSAGNREWQDSVTDLDGVTRTPEDTKFMYAKLGWLAKSITPLGPTAFYGEYGWFKDFISATNDPALRDALTANAAARITGNEAEVWGLGVVQHIEAAEMQVYLGYRHHTADFDLVDSGTGAKVNGLGVEDFDTLIGGSKIAF
jgi:predicted porin